MKKKAAFEGPPKKESVPTETYQTEIEFTCPVRGLVKQMVTVKKYAGVDHQPATDIRPSTAITDVLDQKYSGLTLGDQDVDEEDKSKAN